MLYFGGDSGRAPRSFQRRSATRWRAARLAIRMRPRVNNGISGDARRSTPELGKKAYDQKVDYAVRQIRGFLGMK